MGKQSIADGFTLRAQLVNGAPEIDGVPEDNGRHSEIEAGSPVSLIFKGPITDFTEAVEKHSPGESVFRLAFIEHGMRPPPSAGSPIQSRMKRLWSRRPTSLSVFASAFC